MKRNKLVLGTVSFAAIAVSAMVISSLNVEEAGYDTVSLTAASENKIIDGFEIWWRDHHIDNETGEMMTEERYKEGLRQARLIAANQPKIASFDWVEQGPENIGGRTRAIVVDKLDENHIWAASVSGGLVESFNKGNIWQKFED